MFGNYALKSYISISLFASIFILPYTSIENANSLEYQPVSHNKSVNIKNHNDRVQMAQGFFEFSYGGKEIIKKDGVASGINKKGLMQPNTRRKNNISRAKGRTPKRSFLDGGPLPSMTWTKNKKKEKTKRKKLSLPTWGDK